MHSGTDCASSPLTHEASFLSACLPEPMHHASTLTPAGMVLPHQPNLDVGYHVQTLIKYNTVHIEHKYTTINNNIVTMLINKVFFRNSKYSTLKMLLRHLICLLLLTSPGGEAEDFSQPPILVK